MPDWFALEFQLPDGTWMVEAFCTPEHFARNAVVKPDAKVVPLPKAA